MLTVVSNDLPWNIPRTSLGTPTCSFFSHHSSILPFISFLLDEVQALPGCLHHYDFHIPGLIALHSCFSLPPSLAFSTCRCRCGSVWVLNVFCFPAGLFFSSSFVSACTWAREQLCLYFLPMSSAQQPVISVWRHRYQRRRKEGKRSLGCCTVQFWSEFVNPRPNFSNRERFILSQGKLWSLDMLNSFRWFASIMIFLPYLTFL